MKILIAALALLALIPAAAEAGSRSSGLSGGYSSGYGSLGGGGGVHVDSYTRNDGTYVPQHYRSAPNSSTSDNWSTRGNYNPYTGSWGTRSPW